MPLLSSLAAAAFGPPNTGPELTSGNCTDGVPLLSPAADGDLLFDGVVVGVEGGPACQAGPAQTDADNFSPLGDHRANARHPGSAHRPDLPPFPVDRDVGSKGLVADADGVSGTPSAEGVQPPQSVEDVAAACLRMCAELEKTISRDVLAVGTSVCGDSEFATRSTVGQAACVCVVSRGRREEAQRNDAARELRAKCLRARGRGGTMGDLECRALTLVGALPGRPHASREHYQ